MDFKSLKDVYKLSDGSIIPCVGFGTWQSENGESCYNAVMAALEAGYIHIDTAAAYGNEESVGQAIKDFCVKTGTPRSSLYITTKLWNDDHGYETAKKAIDKSLKALQLDYLDLYLIHWPNPIKFRDCWKEKNAESWRAMEEAVKAGKIRSLGISNFCERHIDALLETAQIEPVVNQIKLCPGQTQNEVVEYSRSHEMLLEAYSPLGTGAIFTNETMNSLAKKYERTVAQICIRWSLQQGYLPLPKSVTKERIISNADVFNFELSPDDCAVIAGLQDSGIKIARNPDEAPF